jgi:hypothetical protein
LRTIADPKLVPQLGQHPLEPLRVPCRLHTNSYWLLQTGVKLLGLSVPVFEAALDEFAGLGIHHRDLLKTGMKVTAYNQHVRLLPSESWSVRPAKLTRPGEEPTSLSHHGSNSYIPRVLARNHIIIVQRFRSDPFRTTADALFTNITSSYCLLTGLWKKMEACLLP